MKDETFDQSVLRELEERLLQAEVRKSAPAMSDLLDDDFIEYGSSGRIFNKDQIIEALRLQPTVRLTVSDFHARLLAPGVALATYRATNHGHAESAEIHSLRSSVWKFTAGRWQIVFHQGTVVKLKQP